LESALEAFLALDELGIHTAKILIITRREDTGRMVHGMLRLAGFGQTELAAGAPDLLSRPVKHHSDLIILDAASSELDAFVLMEQLRARAGNGAPVPVLVFGELTTAAKVRALALGAKDFLGEPFDHVDVTVRVQNLLESRRLFERLATQIQYIEERFSARNRELDDTQIEILERLASAVERRDDETGEHARRVGENTALLARELGLPHDEVELLRRAAPLHDVGKVAIPDAILLKPEKLSLEEYELMKAHTQIGARLLGGGQAILLNLAEQIALTHHERWDGKGYPMALRKWTIPVPGRIVAVVDTFDAITHDRPYKASVSIYEAVQELQRLRGIQFDPDAVDAFLRVLEREGYIRRRHPAHGAA
jgi:putative two-component system response regulator